MTKHEITGHAVEIKEIELMEWSPERKALTIKMAGEEIARHGETLRLAALGLLTPSQEDIFGDTHTVSAQVEEANAMISRHLAILNKALAI